MLLGGNLFNRPGAKITVLSQERTCPRCGATVGADDDFCSLCGLRLPKARVAGEPGRRAEREVLEEYEPVEKAPRRPAAAKPPPTRKVVLKKCPNCNTPVREDLKFCPNCGFNLEVARMRLRQRTQSVKAQSYSRRDFFSFEGYQLEGVPMAALMLIIWAAWNFCVAAMAFIRFVEPVLPPPLPSDDPLATTVFSVVIGLLSVLSAIGLLMVLKPLFFVIIVLIVLETIVSIFQLMQAAAGGRAIWENFATGLVGLFIVIGLTVQLLRIHKYFTGGRV